MEKTLSNLLVNIQPENEELKKLQFKSFVISLVRAGISGNGPQILTKVIMQQYLSGISKNDFWVIDTKYVSEKIIIYDVTNHENTNLLTEPEMFFTMLKNNYVQVNIISSARIVDAAKFHAIYNELSTSFNCQITLGKSQILCNDKIIDSTTVSILNELSDKLEKRCIFNEY